ncbi:PrpF domain-containing protein [Ceratobasidium theobromae]|uniref:PrpF domain-containing protein n=1 Tax=Ceratobasidium theobromae TaxID=1582974 RepID=A0A5N5QZP3_9AGAM|nr:PrpF domain-containing protein [Ceratobasidium theobromae]
MDQQSRRKGSPDPDGRQIDGMGGGISSLSKVVILHAPGAQHPAPDAANAFPGVPWANDIVKARDAKSGWDVVYRFCQVGVREPELDWGSTCGNLVSAAAMTAINWNIVQNKSLLNDLVQAGPKSQSILPVRILAANNGLVVTANVPVMLDPSLTEPTLVPVTGGDAVISGVPGTGAPIVIETPLPTAPLGTGNARDVLTVKGHKVECSIIDTGLPVIFVPASRIFELSGSSHTISSSPQVLDTDTTLMDLIESVRAAGAEYARLPLSSASPKVCLVGPVEGTKADLTIRAVSVGNIHRTVPATTLSALASAAAIPGTLVQVTSSLPAHRNIPSVGDVVSLTVAHPAGTAAASVKIGNVGGDVRPEAIVYTRTARLLFVGSVAIPESVFQDTN